LPAASARRILAASYQEENVLRQTLALVLAASLAWAPIASGQPAASDAEVLRGIRQVEDGDYDPAIVTLDAAARRLTGDPARARDLSQAYLYLGIAYIGKGHEAAAKAKFREAVAQIKDLTLSPDKFPPKVIDLFEAARQEARAQSAPAPAAAPTPAPAAAAAAPGKKGGGGKTILIVGGLAAVGGGVALAAGGGGGSSTGGGGATPTPSPSPATNRSMQTFNGTLADQESRGFVVTATRAGTLDAMLTWQDRSIRLSLDCQLEAPPYTQCGTSNRTSDTTAGLSASVIQTSYLIVVGNFNRRDGTEAFTLTVLYP
jgi:hypothetical protein